MTISDWLIDATVAWLPVIATLAVILATVFCVRWLLERRASSRGDKMGARGQLLLLLLTGAGVLAVVLTLPLDDATRSELLGLIGLLLTATIALSSTTFIGNAMAGLMLRAIRNVRPGDFVRVGEHFGRVSEQGLLHTEIQTEDRDLTTLPNLLLVTNPVTVVRHSGTVLSATVSLGYDQPREDVERQLLEAALEAGLEDPFVQIQELGDFAVTYRVAGMLEDVKLLLSSRSRLRACMLDSLHAGGVEIVSPSFMNQRALDPHQKVLPARPRRLGRRAPRLDDAPPPEARIFDKADQAETASVLKAELEAVSKEIEQLAKNVKDADDATRTQLESELRQREAHRAELGARLAAIDTEDESPAGA